MVKDLFPDFDIQIRYGNTGEFFFLNSCFRHIIRQKRNFSSFLQHLCDQACITEFQKGCDLQGKAGKVLIQKLLVAGIPFCEDKRFADQLFTETDPEMPEDEEEEQKK